MERSGSADNNRTEKYAPAAPAEGAGGGLGSVCLFVDVMGRYQTPQPLQGPSGEHEQPALEALSGPCRRTPTAA